MRRKPDRHPSLTPLRALGLLRRLERDGAPPTPSTLSEVKDALEQHVAHHLVRRRRRPAR